jgi:hypothetical protein
MWYHMAFRCMPHLEFEFSLCLPQIVKALVDQSKVLALTSRAFYNGERSHHGTIGTA